jgi:hypothetical protein
MQDVLIEKVRHHYLNHYISHEVCSFTGLDQIRYKGPYDFIFSNFAGLNCTNQLKLVLEQLDTLLKPGGHATLVLLPKFCLWEFMLMFRGKFRTAFRRFSGRRGTKAKIENTNFRCWYYNPSFIRKHIKNNFRVLKLEGLCTLVPPSYISDFAEKYPKLYTNLVKKEEKVRFKWPWRVVGDYYIITLEKRG